MRSQPTAPFPRRVAASFNITKQVSKHPVNMPTHCLLEDGTGAVAGFALAASPGSVFSLHGPSQDSQHAGRNRVSHAAAILAGTDIQAQMRAVLDGPILTDQLEQPGRVRLFGPQAGDYPDGFGFLLAAVEFADALHARQLHDVRKTHLLGRDGHDFNAAPFNSSVALLDLQQLRGKNLPAGSVALGPATRSGCL